MLPDMFPDFSYEQRLYAQGHTCVAGVDEVGRGPWAGPVVAAAVVLDATRLPQGATDSKKLKPEARAALYEQITACAHVALGEASVAEIDALNILRATELAMCRAVAGLPVKPSFVVVDGNRIPRDLHIPAAAVVKGDGKVMSIACASIVAKVVRDRLMAELAQKYPHYGWHTNAGYGTAAHQAGMAKVGVCEHHRRSFRPVREFLAQQNVALGGLAEHAA